jgi:hypothetical protein
MRRIFSPFCSTPSLPKFTAAAAPESFPLVVRPDEFQGQISTKASSKDLEANLIMIKPAKDFGSGAGLI